MKLKKSGGLFLVGAVVTLLLFGSMAIPDAAQAEVIIIANASVNIDGITKDKLKAIFTGQQVTWSDGKSIKPVLLSDGDLHKEFVRGYVGKTTNQFQNYWRKMIFTGQGIQPRAFASEQDVVDYVAETQGAIGYISSSNKAAKTKTLSVSEN
jgi:ABC-type phosphate transport system substrate-binding protein